VLAVAQIPYAFPKNLVRMRWPRENLYPTERIRMSSPQSVQFRVKSSAVDAATTLAVANVLRDSDHPVDSLFHENFLQNVVWHTANISLGAQEQASRT